MDLKVITIMIPFLMNFILLFNRNKKWAKSKYRWIGISCMFTIGLTLYLTDISVDYRIPKIIIWSIMTPMIFSIMDYIFKFMSYGIHNRDLYLWVRGSSDIDDSKLSGGRHVRASDRLFSMIMLFSIIFLPFLGILILK